MRNLKRLAVLGAACIGLSGLAADQRVGEVRNFGPNLATGPCRNPEGLALDKAGNIYIASNSDAATTVGHVCVMSPAAVITDVIDVPAGPVGAIGLLGEIVEGRNLWVLDIGDTNGDGRVLRINLDTHAVQVLATGLTFPNGIAEDRQGNMYVTDSFEGRVYKFSPDGSSHSSWFQSAQLQSTNPDQQVGANGIAFDEDQNFAYIANTGMRQIFRLQKREDGSAGALELFADGAAIDAKQGLPSPTALFGCDGIQFDVAGHLFVNANQAAEVQVLNHRAKLVARYSGSGDNVFDFNASLMFRGDDVFITNMSAADGGGQSKVSLLEAPFKGLPLN